MFPILSRYGRFFLYSYTVVWGIGLVLAIGLTAIYARRYPYRGWQDSILVTLVAALGGGRLMFVWLHADYFQEQPFEAWQLWLGGLSYQGALLAGCVALFTWWGRNGRKHASWQASFNLLAPALTIVTIFGWLACLLEGCAYGREALRLLPFITADLPDNFGVQAVRYHTQLWGMVLSFLLFLIIVRTSNHQRFGRALLGITMIHALVSLWRGDMIYLELSLGFDASLAILSLLLLQYAKQQKS